MAIRFKGSLQGSFCLTEEIRTSAAKISVDDTEEFPYFTFMLINETVNQQSPSPDLDSIFGALADPTRRAILARLAQGEVSVKGLAEPFKISLPAVSRHLKVLERAGLITRGREAQWRPCRLQAGALKEAGDWIERYRRVWEGRLAEDQSVPVVR